MKGITPVVAIILLLLITIAIVGFAMVFFQRTVTSATESGQEQLNSQTSQLAKTAVIANTNCVEGTSTINIRNTGTQSIAASEVSVFIDNTIKTCAWSGMPVTAGGSATCTVAEAGDSTGKNAKLSAPGSTDQVVCN